MKIALICPSNILYMPYVNNYEKILNENKLNYDVINWDRFSIEAENNFLKYRDKKIGHQRNFFDYYNYAKFVMKKLNATHYDKIIIFGIQLSFFLERILRKKYKNNYLLDIRDYHKIMHCFNAEMLINNASFTVISSSGYKEWLPKDQKYFVNHNTQISSLSELSHPFTPSINNKITVAYIGALRDYQVNIDLINALSNKETIALNFHGEGVINKKIQDYLDHNSIKNVFLTGRYEKKEEVSLYYNNDLINVLRDDNGINNKTALPNRLYNAAIFGKPMLGIQGSFLADQIDKFKLGLVMDSFNNVEEKILNYFSTFDSYHYKQGRENFFVKVMNENLCFVKNLKEFLELPDC